MILTFARPNVRAQVVSGNLAVFGFPVSGNAPPPVAPETGFDHEPYIAASPNRLAVRFGFRPIGQSSANVTPPPDNTSTVGFRWVTGPGRNKLIELYEAERAERELRERLKKKKQVPDAIREAVSEASAVIETAEHAPQTDQVGALLADLSKSLDAIRLNAAKSMAAEQALWAVEVARRLREEIAAQEDEEEAITLLLLH